jgi:hypothetical protein
MLFAAVCLAAACQTRSISDPYEHERNLYYTGELTEFQVLGLDDSAALPASAAGTSSVNIRRGSAILLIQSGALIPDEPMQAALRSWFRVIPFSGSPANAESDYSRKLRAAATRAGCEAVVCYWGFLEKAQRNLATKSVSWVPIVGSFIPDETQEMRIRLKVLCMDPRTGAWSAFAPTADEDTAVSMGLTRASSDVDQVGRLKQAAYRKAAEELVHRFSR